MEGVVRELRHALGRLRRAPGFSAVALATLALAIGANTALFSVVHTVLLQALPFREPDRLFLVWSRHTSTDRYPFQLPEFCDYRDQNKSFESVAALANWSASLRTDGPAERVPGMRVTGNFFEMMGTRPAVGRLLQPADDTPGREKVVVLGHGLWQRRFGGDPGVIGRTVQLSDESYVVVGVLDPGFLFPVRDVDVSVPLAPETDARRHNRESTSFLRMVGRARPGTSAAQIAGDLNGIARRLQQEFPTSYARKPGVRVIAYQDELTRNVGQALWVLLGAVVLLLLVACANLANLTLVRATEQQRELAVRLALGARPSRLRAQLLAESGLLALGGAVLGTLLARWAVPLLVAASPASLPRAGEIELSLPVLGFTMGVAVATTLLFGLLPAVRAARLDPAPVLQSGGRGGPAGGGRLRGLIVAAEVALMTVLLCGAGLLYASFRELMRVEPGFATDVLSLRLSLPPKAYSETERVSRFYQDLEQRVAALPGVLSVAAVNHVPLNGALASADYKVAGRPPVAEDALPTAEYRMVTPAYFRTLGVPLLAGRAFVEDDRAGGAAVAIVSQALARQSFPGRDPLGEHLLVKDTPEGFRSMEIVGVVGDVKHGSLEAPVAPHLYVPYHQTHRVLLTWLTQNQFLVVKAAGDPLALADAVRRELGQVDPGVASADARLTGFYVDNASAARRFSLVLVGVFSAVALAMAALGLYGVVSYGVAQRTRETGVRLALGAGVGDIVLLVLGDGLKRTLLGVGIGLVAAAAATRGLRGLLYGVTAGDPRVYAAVVAVLLAVGLLASVLPAWRAARLPPLVALRLD